MNRITFPNGMTIEADTVDDAVRLMTLMKPTTMPASSTAQPVATPPPVAPSQTSAIAPFQPNLFREREVPNPKKRGDFVTLPQFAGLENARPKSSMFRLFQLIAASFPKWVFSNTACESLGWAKETVWEYACALEDAGLIEKKHRNKYYIARITDLPTAEATIAEFVYVRNISNHHYLRVKDRSALAVSASKQQEG